MSAKPKPRRKPTPRRSKPLRKLNYDQVAHAPAHFAIPTWWLNSVIGLFLLVPAGLLTQTLFTSFSRITVQHQFWATPEFWFFSLGTILWTLAFSGSIWVFGRPRLLRVYVFGHELTHAIWVWMMNGKVSAFKVTREGGYILTDTHNVWIALAPYFYPIYSIVVVTVFGVVSIFYDISLYIPVMFGLLGVTWAFHMTFTIWMIPKGQSDLTHFGTFYSLAIIYILNLVLLVGLLVLATPEVTFLRFATELLLNTENLAESCWRYLRLILPGQLMRDS